MSAAQPLVSDEIHIVSMVVHVSPARSADILKRLQAIGGLEIQVTDSRGKAVVTLEADDEARLFASIEEIHAVDGVLAANLVYHQSESAALLAEEIDDENHAP